MAGCAPCCCRGPTPPGLSATGAELIRTVDEVAEIARSSARLASTGRGNLEMMDDTMHLLQESSGSISGKLSVINERAGDITNVVTAINLGLKLGPDATVVTVMCDSGVKYLSTAVYAAGGSG